MLKVRSSFVMIVCALLAIVPVAQAQVTTGNLAGTVRATDGSALPGVTVEAVHTPTGTAYTAVSGVNGRFVIPNVRVGGPYRVTANLEGFRTQQVGGIEVRLGQTAEVPVELQLAAVAEAITVTADADPIINPNRTGSSSQVSVEQIESLPTVNRSLQDYARTNPYFVVAPSDDSGTIMNVAGKNARYNSIQIDGAANNDLFGLASSGTPGGQANTQPISLDALEQLQLVISPYDVRYGGFTGGGINAVTRSGTNDVHGSVFGTKRDQKFVGDGPRDIPITNFDQTQYGGRIGGPLRQDRLFFFLSGEVNRREQPTGVSADGSTTVAFRAPQDVARVAEILKTRYQYDPGTLGDISGKTDNDLIFGRLDWNAGNSNQITLRHNYVSGAFDNISNRSTGQWRFPTSIYFFTSKTNSTVAQVNSVFSANAFNEGRINYTSIRDKRNVPVVFPSIEIGGREQSADINAGTERFSGANALDQDILEFTDDFTLIVGNHNLTIGTTNQIFDFGNLFLSDFYGYYFFPTLADFEAGKASIYRIGFVNDPDDPGRKTRFGVAQYGLYVGDQWRINSALTLTLGLRADMPRYEDTPAYNRLVETAINFRTDRTPSESLVWSPRVGFNWQIPGNQQLRGGVGVFAGRTPYVWVSNAYQNTGIETSQLGCVAPSCTPPAFNPDPFTQPRNLGAAGAPTVDMVSEDFEMPRILRGTLAYDRELFFGIRGTIEGIWSKTHEDVYFQNVNYRESGTSPLDGRPTHSRVSTQLVDAIYLTNTSEGEERMWSIQLNRPIARGLTLSASYANQDARSAFDTTSSRAISNWRFNVTRGDIFEPELARSSWEVKHRFTAYTTYSFPTGPLNHSVGLYYNAQSGDPYSLLMGGNPNTDGNSSNDLLYIPAKEDEIILQNAARQVIPYSTLATFLSSVGLNPTAGEILEKNSVFEPWARQLDFHYELGLPIVGTANTHLTFDVFNLLNMFDKEAGVVRGVAFQTYTPIFYAGQDTATGKPIYRENFAGSLNPGRQFSTADFRSRWNARVGVRVNF